MSGRKLSPSDFNLVVDIDDDASLSSVFRALPPFPFTIPSLLPSPPTSSATDSIVSPTRSSPEIPDVKFSSDVWKSTETTIPPNFEFGKLNIDSQPIAADSLKFSSGDKKLEAKRQAKQVTTAAKLEAEWIISDAHSKAKNILKEKDDVINMKKEIDDEKQLWEDHKEKMNSSHSFDSQINLNVGGNKYSTSLATLQSIPESMLGAWFSGRFSMETNASGEYFIDR